jgi:hypothetical protein
MIPLAMDKSQIIAEGAEEYGNESGNGCQVE